MISRLRHAARKDGLLSSRPISARKSRVEKFCASSTFCMYGSWSKVLRVQSKTEKKIVTEPVQAITT